MTERAMLQFARSGRRKLGVASFFLLVLIVGPLLPGAPGIASAHAATPYRVTFTTSHFGYQFLQAQAADLHNPSQATFRLDSGASIWYGIEARAQPTGLRAVAANPADNIINALLVNYGLLPPAGILPINLDRSLSEQNLLAVSFTAQGQRLQLTLTPFSGPALTLDVFHIILDILGDSTLGTQVGLLVPGNLAALFALVKRLPDLVDFITSFSDGIGAELHQNTVQVLNDARKCASDFFHIFKNSDELAGLAQALGLVLGPTIGGIAATLASWASGIGTFLAVASLAKSLADFVFSLGAYLFQSDMLPTVSLQTTPASAPSPTPTPRPTTVPMPQTQTSCPSNGQGRAAVIEPLALGNDQNVVYLDTEGASDTPVSGALLRYDVTTGKITSILSLPSASIFEAQVSTDRQWILLVSDTNSGTDAIQLVRMDGQGLQTLYCTPSQNVSDVQWSPDQMSIALAVITSGGTSPIPTTTIFLLNASTGQLRTLVSTQGPYSGCCVLLSWLDSTRLAVMGVQGTTDFPVGGDPLVLDTSQQPAALTSLFHQQVPASGADSFGAPCYDLASSSDLSQLFISQCSLTKYYPMAGDDVVQEGPSSISVEPMAGGAMHTIYSNQDLAIAAVQTISPTKLLFFAYNYSSHAGKSVDTSQNGLWTINTDGTGLTHLTSATVGETGVFFIEIPRPTWLVVSQDGTLYASSLSNFNTGAESLIFGSLSGGDPTTFLSRQFSFTSSGLRNGNIALVGWTSM